MYARSDLPGIHLVIYFLLLAESSFLRIFRMILPTADFGCVSLYHRIEVPGVIVGAEFTKKRQGRCDPAFSGAVFGRVNALLLCWS